MKSEILIKNGFKYDEAVYRCMGNEDLYERLLKHFCGQDCLINAIDAYNNEDMDAFQRSIHEVKGVAGNLGIEPLFSIAQSIMVLLYQKNYEVADLFNTYIDTYQKTIKTIKEAMAND